MNKQIILDHLEKIAVIESIVKHGSVQKASGYLNISQPSLSTKVKNLEELMGFQIFNRSTKGISLTEKGTLLHDYSKEILRITTELATALENGANKKKSLIRLGIYESIAKYLWPDFYLNFNEKNPQIQVLLSVGRSDKLISQLLSNDIDIAVSIAPMKNKKMTSTLLYTDSLAFFIHKDLYQENLDLNSRIPNNTQVFLFSDAIIKEDQTLSDFTKKFSLQKNQINHVESFEVAAEFCVKKIGISVLPTRVAKNLSDYKSLRIIENFERKKISHFAEHEIKLSILSKNAEHKVFKIFTDELIQSTV